MRRERAADSRRHHHDARVEIFEMLEIRRVAGDSVGWHRHMWMEGGPEGRRCVCERGLCVSE